MTSFTRKLYNRDPAAAEAFASQVKLHELLASCGAQTAPVLTYGKHTTLRQFDSAFHSLPKTFGRRTNMARRRACSEPCGHPACIHGCTLR